MLFNISVMAESLFLSCCKLLSGDDMYVGMLNRVAGPADSISINQLMASSSSDIMPSYEKWMRHVLAYLFGPCLVMGDACYYNTLDKPPTNFGGRTLDYPLDGGAYRWLITQGRNHYQSHQLRSYYLCDYPKVQNIELAWIDEKM
jgi:hypothetical protein